MANCGVSRLLMVAGAALLLMGLTGCGLVAKPGAEIPLRLYLWTADHSRTVIDLRLAIARP